MAAILRAALKSRLSLHGPLPLVRGIEEAEWLIQLAGGGIAHRLGLSDSILVFPEHRVFLDEASAAMAQGGLSGTLGRGRGRHARGCPDLG